MSEEFIDNAYKTGAGRYLQERGAIAHLGEEVLLRGSKAFMLVGPHSFPLVQEAVASSLAAASLPYETVLYEPSPTREDAHALGANALECGCDVIVGVGGGRMMDIAKAVACSAGLPVVEVPTSMATCAAFTPLSVMYTASGAHEGTWRFTREVDAVIVDLDIMANQPTRLIAAGILDSMAKMLEIGNGGVEPGSGMESVQRFAAYQYARVNYELLQQYGIQAYQDASEHLVTDALDRVTFCSIALTGIVSALTRGFHQTAHAHHLYYGMCTYFGDEAEQWLHGELVAIGLLMQLIYNGDVDGLDDMRALMRSMNMPCSLSEVGINSDDKRFAQLYDHVLHSDFVDDGKEWQDRIHRAFEVIA